MRRPAGRSPRIVEFTRLSLRECDQFQHRFRCKARLHHEHVGRTVGHGDRREIFKRLPGKIGLQEGQQPVRAAIQQQRITVGGRTKHDFVRHHAAAILDHDLLTECAGDALCNQARAEVCPAAGFGGHDANGLVWI